MAYDDWIRPDSTANGWIKDDWIREVRLMDSLQGRSLLSLAELTPAELKGILSEALLLKRRIRRPTLQGRMLGLLFRKASTRTRVSFSAAMTQTGGSVIDLSPTSMQVSRGETIADTARVLSRYLDVLAIRTFDQSELVEFAQYASIPVINALTDRYHPCQILADLLTIQEAFGTLQGLTLTYCGDGNNVLHSLIYGGILAGMTIRAATPADFQPDPTLVDHARSMADTLGTGGHILLTEDPIEAVTGSQVLYTDVWASMGQEAEAEARKPKFLPYQLNSDLLAKADAQAIVLHCLPAHRGEEITAEVIDGSQSRVWDQAENRLHAQKALLVKVLGA